MKPVAWFAGHSTQPGHSGDFRQVESTSRQRIGGSGGGNGGRGPGYSYSEVCLLILSA